MRICGGDAAEMPQQEELKKLICFIIFDSVSYDLLIDPEGPIQALVQNLNEI